MIKKWCTILKGCIFCPLPLSYHVLTIARGERLMTKDGDDVEIDVIALPCWWVTLPPRPLTGGVRQTQLPPLSPLCPPCPLPSHLFPHLISCGVAIFTMNINIGEPIFLNIIVYSCK